MEHIMENFKISPFELNSNPWNSNKVSRENLEKLKKSLSSLGSFKPIIVRQLGDKSYEILAGFHRVEAAKELGWSEIEVKNLGLLTDQKAKEISLIDNTRYGNDDSELLEQLINSMDTELISVALPELENLELPELEEPLSDFEEKVRESTDEGAKTLKFRYDDLDKADEIEDKLLIIARDNGYYFADGHANLSEALYHALVRKPLDDTLARGEY